MMALVVGLKYKDSNTYIRYAAIKLYDVIEKVIIIRDCSLFMLLKFHKQSFKLLTHQDGNIFLYIASTL